MGDRGIMLLNGALSLHGDRKNAWSKLSATAKAGSDKIQVVDASGWRKGDVIVLASTDFDPRQAEERTITAISGNALTLDKPLAYYTLQQITSGVDERGEVGLLTRNIKVQASDDAEKSYFGGHIMAMAGSKMYVSGVELNRMGQNTAIWPRYPVHWHVLGEGKGQYIKNASIHDTYSRCVTVHGAMTCSGKQRHLQHRGALLLPRRRHRARQQVHPQPGHRDQVSSDTGLRAREPCRQRRDQRGSCGHPERELLR